MAPDKSPDFLWNPQDAKTDRRRSPQDVWFDAISLTPQRREELSNGFV